MSVLPVMEKLLEGVEVLWTNLGDEQFIEIANSARKPVKAALREAGEIPYYGANNIQDFVKGYTHDGNYVLIAEDGSASLETYSVQYASGRFWANNHVHVLRGKTGLETKFLYHYLQTVNFIPFLNGGDRAKLTKGEVVKIQIPIPPLNIQAEIVRILDAFTAYTAELTAELTARKKQYKHYRDQLLSFSDTEVEWKTLGEVGEFIRGSGLQKKDFVESGVGCIHYGQIYTHYGIYAEKTKTFVSHEFAKKARKATKNDLVIATTSENDEDVCKAVAWLGDAEIAVSSDACFFRHSLNPKFAAYFFQSETFQRQKKQYITGTKVRRVNASSLEKMSVPTPSLEEQARIVAILDKFDALTASISEGLPREIELRQQQYEYYRDRLLSFPKPK